MSNPRVRGGIVLVIAVALIPLVPAASGAAGDVCDPASGGPASVTAPVGLCGTTVVSGNAAGWASVTIPRTARIEPTVGDGGGVEIEGAGPFIGVALVEEPPPPEPRGLVAALTPVEPEGSTFIGLGGLEDCAVCILPAGDYRLYLLTSGTNVSVTLRLQGLSGSITLHPARSMAFQARDLTRHVDLGHNLVAVTSGDSFELPGPGFLYRGIRLLAVEVTATGVFRCTADPLPAYVPVCKEGNAVSGGGTWAGHGQDPAVTEHGLAGPGRYAQGAWFVSPVPPERADAVAAWLSF
ncbi:MAG: hypothetical protein M3245_04850 [Actinomycetota bacterium]|nr:hypothetical protein [Actinomycetota bacterium]